MEITILECRRMISREILLGFLIFVFGISVYGSYKNLDRYNVRDAQGISVTWKDNLSEAKKESEGLFLDKESLKNLQEDENRYGHLNSENIMALVSCNYEGRPLAEIADEEMDQFFQIRAETIYENLILDTQKGYTDQEIATFRDKAEALSVLSMGYAEGWKILSEKLGGFVFWIAIVIAVLLLPLFGRDPAVKMEELLYSSKYGKRRLDMARVLAAYGTATVLFVCGMAIYIVITMLPFGFAGAGQPIQSSAGMFFSLYNITYLQQFLWNLFRGYAVLLFMVSLVLMVTICIRNILASASGIAIFMVMLVIFNQVYLYPVNHWFTNFMPVRMTEFRQFYLGNERYRIFGVSISCMSWSMIVVMVLSVLFLIIGIITRNRNKDARMLRTLEP